MSRFSAGSVTVRSPATCANLGPGFDSFGLAVDLRDSVAVRVASGGVDVQVAGEGAEGIPRDEQHLVVRAMRAAFDLLGLPQPGLRLSCTNRVPHGRGLGSSAAAVVSGIRAAEALVPGSALESGQALSLAASLEGHPDNVAACLLGGFTVAWMSGPRAGAVALNVHRDVSPVLFVPPTSLSTELARSLLPDRVTHLDARLNSGRAGLLVAALTRFPEELLTATEDRLHQQYRRSAMPGSVALMDRLRAAGIAAAISGSGPAVVALGIPSGPVEPARWSQSGWDCLPLPVARAGASVRKSSE